MYKIMTDGASEDRDKISCAKDFLDRAGFKPVEKQEIIAEINIEEQTDFIEQYLNGEEDEG